MGGWGRRGWGGEGEGWWLGVGGGGERLKTRRQEKVATNRRC